MMSTLQHIESAVNHGAMLQNALLRTRDTSLQTVLQPSTVGLWVTYRLVAYCTAAFSRTR